MRYAILFLLFMQALTAQNLPVVLKKRFWPDARGEIQITQQGITFRYDGGKKSRFWSYPDIQSFDRLSKTEFVIFSYEDQRWQFGRDRRYHFRVLSGKLSDALFTRIRQRLDKPVTDRVVDKIPGVDYELPVKHLRMFGGTQGKLIFTPEAIYYSTPNKKDARVWRLKEEVQSVWSADPYSLELNVYENNSSGFSSTRVFKFALKEPLDPEFYRRLKLKLYQLQASRMPW